MSTNTTTTPKAMLWYHYEDDGIYEYRCNHCGSRLFIQLNPSDYWTFQDTRTITPDNNFPVKHCWHCQAIFEKVVLQ